MSLVDLKDAGIRLGGETILRDVNFGIERGEIVTIVGPNGSGKSTLLRLLSGLYTAQSGAVTLNNYGLDQLSEDVVRRHIGYLSQSTRLIRGSLRDSLLMGLPHLADE